MPYTGRKAVSAEDFQTGLEGFDVPWEVKQPKASSGGYSSGSGGMSGGFGGIEPDESEDRDIDGDAAARAAQDAMEDRRFKMLALGLGDKEVRSSYEDAMRRYRTLVNQARFFLPRTLDQLGSQYASQGSYYSSGRRGAQEEAAKKTAFDLQEQRLALAEAQRKARFELAKNLLSKAQVNNAFMDQMEQAMRSQQGGD